MSNRYRNYVSLTYSNTSIQILLGFKFLKSGNLLEELRCRTVQKEDKVEYARQIWLVTSKLSYLKHLQRKNKNCHKTTKQDQPKQCYFFITNMIGIFFQFWAFLMCFLSKFSWELFNNSRMNIILFIYLIIMSALLRTTSLHFIIVIKSIGKPNKATNSMYCIMIEPINKLVNLLLGKGLNDIQLVNTCFNYRTFIFSFHNYKHLPDTWKNLYISYKIALLPESEAGSLHRYFCDTKTV